MTTNGKSETACEPTVHFDGDWLAMDHTADLPGRGPVVAWCEAHAGLILMGANVALWGAVACGFHFG